MEAISGFTNAVGGYYKEFLRMLHGPHGPCDQAPVPQVVVDESRLIDLPLAEQKRRGNELLSLLSDPWLHSPAKSTGRLPSGTT